MTASTVDQARCFTAEDLLKLPSDARYELIRGELITMPPPPGGEHGSRTMTLASFATVHAIATNLGQCFAAETGFRIAGNPDTVIAPDWAFIAKDRVPSPMPRGYVPVAPDIVLETRSPNDSPREVALKVDLWLASGVQIVWELDPAARRLAVHRQGRNTLFLGSDDVLTGEDVLPGFSLAMAVVFT